MRILVLCVILVLILFKSVPDQSLMTQQPVKFEKPPVIETVLGVQFDPIPMTNAIAGWYWKSALGQEWANANQVQRIEDVFEKFGSEREWRIPNQIRLFQKPTQDRLQISRKDNERMIQVQDTRFIYNWRKIEGSRYPSYDAIIPEFEQQFEGFRDFVTANNLGEIKLNQWEVTYVNHIPKVGLWEGLNDWPNIIPYLRDMFDARAVDAFSSSCQQEIGRQQGRLHTDIKFAKAKSESNEELLLIQLTARGPIDENQDFRRGCDFGHSEIVSAFISLTSDSAHKFWKGN